MKPEIEAPGAGAAVDPGDRAGPVYAILLAAGESTRMGELKALLPWDGRPLLRYAVDQLLASPVERVAVVLGHRADELRAVLPAAARLRAVHNPAFAQGKVSSILSGLAALAPDGHILVLGVDQPRPAALLHAVVRAHLTSGARITVAACNGRGGHPILFAPSLRPALMGISEAGQGLREVLRRHGPEVRRYETGDPLVLTNLNTPADYEAARRLLS